MPIYTYKCAACNTQHDLRAKISDPPPQRCPTCQAEGQLHKQIARSSFQLKGDGWYSGGYEGASNKSGGGASGGGSSGGES
jgi:putative FmdB family regulatory protein